MLLFENFNDPVGLIIRILVLLMALVLHEIAHALVAYWNGDPTAKNMGRLSPNPLVHLDPIGTMMILFAPVGWAKPVPVNPNNFTKLRRGIFTVAIAGVTVNLILSFFSVPLFLLFNNVFIRMAVPGSVWLAIAQVFRQFFLISMVLNLGLVIFNLLPIFPLDGFRVVESFTHHRNPYCVFMRKYGRFIFFGLILWGVVVSELLPMLGVDLWFLNPFYYFIWLMDAILWVFLQFWGLMI